MANEARPSSIAALREPNYLLFTIGSLISLIGRQMLTVALGWDLYERTGSALALGAVGLAQFTPVLLLTLHAGLIVDSYDRRKVLIAAQALNVLATGGLVLLTLWEGPLVWHLAGMYACVFLAGVGRAFHSPASAAIVPQVVSQNNFTNAITWGSMTFQTAAILGPALGGLLLAWTIHAATQGQLPLTESQGALPVYLVDGLCTALFGIALLFVKNRPHHREDAKRAVTLQTLLSGLDFVRQTKIILAAITLDMFAVLFGGAIALMPVFAKDILHVGPGGLGWLQAAPSIGAIAMGLVIARRPHFRKTGHILLWTVIGFGIATIVFGLSRSFWLSLAMLALAGAFDNVSVIIRQALVQLRTPDNMRGRVSAINFVFIGTSNELGGFESGLVASGFGPVFSVVFGGIATIVTVLSVAFAWPELRQLDRLEEDPNTLHSHCEEPRKGDAAISPSSVQEIATGTARPRNDKQVQ